ncbi:MAG TPA: CoA transferase, partial [Dehalococcoidia bacterium]|nr:CoA transferase [Dehalococcoidia bacterium]
DFLLRHDLLIPLDHSDWGPFYRLPFAVEFSDAPNEVKPAAGIGEHTRSLLNELGYSAAEVDRLVAEHIVR